MPWYAVESVDDAIDATRSFLFPFDLGTWLRLALISLFVGVGSGGVSSLTNIVNLPASMPSELGEQETLPVPPEPSPEALPVDYAVIAGVVAGVLILGVLLAIVSATLRLVFYDGLRTGTVRFREPARRRFGQALKLFGFKLLVTVGFGLPVVLISGVALLSVPEVVSGAAMIVGGLLAVGVLIVSVIAYVVVMRVTDEFIVPVMVLTDSGVLASWRRFWPVFRSQLSQFGVYIIVHFLLLLAISIGQSLLAVVVFGIVGTIAALAALVVVFGAFGGVSATLASTVGLVVLGAIALFALLVAFVCYLPVAIVVLTYVVSYEVSVLGAADEELQLLPSDSGDPESSTVITA